MLTDGADQFESLHLRGLIKLQQQDYEAARASLGRPAGSASVKAWANLGLA
jgi:hypothetical protein